MSLECLTFASNQPCRPGREYSTLFYCFSLGMHHNLPCFRCFRHCNRRLVHTSPTTPTITQKASRTNSRLYYTHPEVHVNAVNTFRIISGLMRPQYARGVWPTIGTDDDAHTKVLINRSVTTLFPSREYYDTPLTTGALDVVEKLVRAVCKHATHLHGQLLQ